MTRIASADHSVKGQTLPRITWNFAGFEFNPARGLSRAGVVLPLQAKPKGLLEILLRADGAVVTKDTIAAALWSDEIPSDASIARAVRGLRKALGDDADDVVHTVYSKGVQLVCPIAVTSAHDEADRKAIAQLLRTAWEIAETRTPDSFARAIKTLTYATTRYPDAASAWALLADAHASMAIRNMISPAAAATAIQNCCNRALRSDPSCAQALAVSGWALGMLMGRGEEGLRRLDSGIQEGSDWPTFLFRAWLQIQRRNLAGAIDDIERGLSISPLNRSLIALRAFAILYQGKINEADAFARKAQQVRDDVAELWLVRSIVASEKGELTQSCSHAERAAALMRNDRQTATYLAYAYARAGASERANKVLLEMGLGDNAYRPALLAAPYLALGKIEEARQIIRRAQAERCPSRVVIWCDPRMKPLWTLA